MRRRVSDWLLRRRAEQLARARPLPGFWERIFALVRSVRKPRPL